MSKKVTEFFPFEAARSAAPIEGSFPRTKANQSPQERNHNAFEFEPEEIMSIFRDPFKKLSPQNQNQPNARDGPTVFHCEPATESQLGQYQNETSLPDTKLKPASFYSPPGGMPSDALDYSIGLNIFDPISSTILKAEIPPFGYKCSFISHKLLLIFPAHLIFLRNNILNLLVNLSPALIHNI